MIRARRAGRLWTALTVAILAAALTQTPDGTASTANATATGVPVVPEWTMAGQNQANTRYNATETVISPANAGRLAPRWVATLGGNVAATPTVSLGTVFVPDYGGKLNALDAITGAVRWQKNISDYSGVTGDVSRTSPAVYGPELIFGDGVSTGPLTGARVMAADRTNGARLWSTVVDTDPLAMVTTSPVVDGTTVYVGVASHAEFGDYDDVTFRGSVVALNAVTGAVLWKRYLAPDGYTGNSVWGSNFVIDHVTGNLFVTTGNNYTVPDGVCTQPNQQDCAAAPEDNYTDAVVALNPLTGAVNWSFKTLTADVGDTDDCDICGPDYDFGSSPNLFTVYTGGRFRSILGIGQKSGIYWALDPATGKEIWHTVVGPGSDLGGMEWGSATDGRRIYVGVGNYDHESYDIVGADGRKSTIDGGSWAALDAATGQKLWQVTDPYGTIDVSFLSAANGVVYSGGVKGDQDTMFALDASDGQILWRYHSGGAVIGGAAITGGTVFWGSGYWFGLCDDGTYDCAQNNKLYAFSPR
ncbi:polyvinyl alcohol dehydrogenase (cytochrome) [Amycolatopsis bartoniae]|uniref:outer membrane protein assembly factor BamB family protein n=1 Tax=Amycolatopsis bartoniae TaxID=941986 RepID=UPI00118EEDD4|nr:PQQ-binding-like beta-propeller repeat protein [Amycolatopsis bartoniae]MBB2938633.1 polyvinyl alcohol dehydrogenase (cytochrome) [Amycolatopsis bartoniae]TVT08872.1 PQQ-binding-like beta-propeller repeat protein [Amycolatopsis bartoniae]